MTEEERDTMIKIGKAVTDLGESVKKLSLWVQEDKKPGPIKSTFDIPRPPTISVVDHEGLSSRFKMEISFEQGAAWTQQQRMDHSIKLLTEMEDLLKDYGVTNLSGNYSRHVTK